MQGVQDDSIYRLFERLGHSSCTTLTPCTPYYSLQVELAELILFHRHLLVIAQVDALWQTGEVCAYVLAVERVDAVREGVGG